MAKKKNENVADINRQIEELMERRRLANVQRRQKDREGFDQACAVAGSLVVNAIGDWKTVGWDALEGALLAALPALEACATGEPLEPEDGIRALKEWARPRRRKSKRGVFLAGDAAPGKVEPEELPAGPPPAVPTDSQIPMPWDLAGQPSF